MLAGERRRCILQLIQEGGSVQIGQLAESLGVSAMTVRRDLDYLAAEHKVLRTHGGAMLRNEDIREYPLKLKHEQNMDAKTAIAREAAKLLGPGQSIVIDAGSTNIQLAATLKEYRDLLVTTNDLKVALELGDSDGIDVLLVGGQVKRAVYSLEGYYSENFLSSLYFDTAFIGCDAFSLQRGVMTNSVTKVALKKVMLSNSQRRVLMADASKLERFGTASFASLDTFHVLVTDERISPEFVDVCQNIGLEVNIAKIGGGEPDGQGFYPGG